LIDPESLRQYLIDMNEFTLRTDAASKEIDGGLEFAVTCTGRRPVAIQRMVLAWAQVMNGYQGWSTKAASCRTVSLLPSRRLPEGSAAHSRSRPYWPIGERRLASSAAAFGDGEGRVRHEHLGQTH
jgi:hypothetical protein